MFTVVVPPVAGSAAARRALDALGKIAERLTARYGARHRPDPPTVTATSTRMSSARPARARSS
jgi:hypothetical protein